MSVKRLRKPARLLLIALAVVLVWIAWQFRLPPLPPNLPDYHAEKAVWLEISWAMETHSADQIQALAESLQKHQINTVFAYVSYLKPGDFFNPTYNHASDFVRRFHEAAPQIRILAWIGVPIQITLPNGEYIANRLENPDTRNQIASFAADMVNDYGFDGIHLNAEVITNDDPAFIETLKVIRSALPAQAMLSTTAQALRVTQPVTVLPYPALSSSWSTDYLRLVAQYSDQIALMAYDSGLFFPSDYRAWMQYQVETSAAALEGVETDFLVGVPVSEEWTLSHNITSEYLENALYGVQTGLAETNNRSNIDGIAIYPYWELDAGEWALLDQFP